MVVSSPSGPPATAAPPSSRANGVLLDVQGTVLEPNGMPYPGAVEAITRLKQHGISLSFVSNLTSAPKEVLVADLEKVGFPVTATEVVTTSQLTVRYLHDQHPGARVMVLAAGIPFGPDDGLLLVDDDPEVVVLGGLGDWLCSETLDAVLRQVRRGVPLVAMHRNLSWQTEAGLSLDLGALLPGIETVGRTRAEVIGKPAPAFFELALETVGMSAGETLMVGDDVDFDVRAAQAIGITGVLVKTGKCVDDGWQHDGGAAPDLIIDSIADLPAVVLGGGF